MLQYINGCMVLIGPDQVDVITCDEVISTRFEINNLMLSSCFCYLNNSIFIRHFTNLHQGIATSLENWNPETIGKQLMNIQQQKKLYSVFEIHLHPYAVIHLDSVCFFDQNKKIIEFNTRRSLEIFKCANKSQKRFETDSFLLSCNDNLFVISNEKDCMRKRVINVYPLSLLENHSFTVRKSISILSSPAFAHVVFEKKILFFTRREMHTFDCESNSWLTSYEYVVPSHRSAEKASYFRQIYQYRNRNFAVIPSLHPNIIHFPFWYCDCVQHTKCNYYNLETRTWKFCVDGDMRKTTMSTYLHFLFLE